MARHSRDKNERVSSKYKVSNADAKTVLSIIDDAMTVNGQSAVIRYNGKPTLHKQNLYEHHGSTCQLVTLICERYNIPEHDQLLAMKRAVTHDLPEIWLSDMPFNTHVEFEKLSEAYDDAEHFLLDTKLKHFNHELEKGSSTWHIVKAADCLDVVLFCSQEMALGNCSDVILDMRRQDIKLAKEHLDELESRYGRQ